MIDIVSLLMMLAAGCLLGIGLGARNNRRRKTRVRLLRLS
jgi:glucose-6-phosphate-specific signal transduction histidine kinase